VVSVEQWAEIRRLVLVEGFSQRAVARRWSVEEIGRELGDRSDAIDSIRRLTDPRPAASVWRLCDPDTHCPAGS
jgi:hypothetical protein